MKTKVILIGGAPCTGKTTLGRLLAGKLGWTSLSADDLCVAVKEVTTPESHPGLHLMEKGKHIEYFSDNTPEKLIQDAIDQQNAIWPSLKRVIENHATFGSPVVIDGCMLNPEKVVSLNRDTIKAFWMYVSEEVLLKRESKNKAFFSESVRSAQILDNFMARSFWYNKRMTALALENKFPILRQNGLKSINHHIESILQSL